MFYDSLPIFLLSIVAAFIQRSIGFGFGIFIMTMLPYFMPSFGEATTLSGCMATLTSLYVAWENRRHLDWHKMALVLVSFGMFAFIFVTFLSMMGERTLRHILGIMLIASSIWFCFLSNRVHLRPTRCVQVVAGSLSGIMGGLFGMQGPPVVVYFLACTETKEQYIALTQTYFIIGNILLTVFRAGHGMFTMSVVESFLYGVPGIAIGTMLGAWTFRRMPMSLMRKIIYLYIGVSGVVAMMG